MGRVFVQVNLSEMGKVFEGTCVSGYFFTSCFISLLNQDFVLFVGIVAYETFALSSNIPDRPWVQEHGCRIFWHLDLERRCL